MALQFCSWSDLPIEILELIFDCSKDPIDILRCGAACKSWLPTALLVHRKFLSLCLIDKDILFNILTKQTRNLHLPDEARGRRIFCSNNGWLLTIDDTDLHSNMHLLNIFTRTLILLPPIMSLYRCDAIGPHRELKLAKWKLLLSKSPSSSNYIIVLFHNISSTSDSRVDISFCKTGDILWTFCLSASYFLDVNGVILYRQNKIYLSFENRPYIKFDNLPTKQTKGVGIPVPKHWWSSRYSYFANFLVKSDHEDDVLFAGCRGTRSDLESDGTLFLVYKFDFVEEQFKEVNDLGGYALLLSPNDNHLLTKTTAKSKPSLKANCIYFLRDFYEQYGIFDLKTKDIEYVPCQSITNHANWINLDV